MSGRLPDRRAKRAALLAAGVDPYPPARTVDVRVADLWRRYGALPPGTRTGVVVSVAGRIVGRREHRAVAFATLRDGAEEIQVLLAGRAGADGPRAAWRERTDLGDLVVVDGEVVTTDSGALAVAARHFTMAAKALRPPPGRTAGAAGAADGGSIAHRDRYRQMLLDPAATARAQARGAALRSLREGLYGRGFTEADTPLLHPLPSGTARPFTARMNAWGLPLYLRGTAEMYLKRLVVGGLDQVFEIGRAFRNEGADALHFPEFTVCEAYAVHSDYLDAAALAEALVTAVARALAGPGTPTPAIARKRFHDLLGAALGTSIDASTPCRELAGHAARHGIAVPAGTGPGALAHLLYRKLAEPRIERPTFVFDFPAEGAILARPHRADPALVETWTLVIGGLDVGQGCTELTDPVEQRRRFADQATARAARGLDATVLDEGFLAALEHGLPPLGGLVLGVDRLITALRGDGRLRDNQCHPISRPGPASGGAPHPDRSGPAPGPPGRTRTVGGPPAPPARSAPPPEAPAPTLPRPQEGAAP
ncbi:amino acid--tRNA ligase-related protein [Streptomyces sp. HSG2]|uniref:amino acid--tRNA ligase-related protein n=1 Tax=Streptomyces sp. HSG2 TaxID=2797167 RepID=UPI0019040D0B|nr:amino acid--tRNA ligase-related protein [Streptomyces sp. HSG2]